jgi:septum formation protein
VKSAINVPLILASSSPRRIELLKSVHLEFLVRAPEVDETPVRGESPLKMVKRLSELKAFTVSELALHEFGGAVLIAADTTVVAPNGKTVLGKPVDDLDAARMLRSLSGKTHVVYTAYCILAVGREMKSRKWSRIVRSKVTMRKLSSKMIEKYILTGESKDKAGAYAAQGIGATFIESIHGSYTNVVGLPMAQLLEDLEKRFGIFPFGIK